MDCAPGLTVRERPVKLRGGVVGSATLMVTDVLAVAAVLSVTVTVTLELPGAVGVPDMVPLVGEIVSPAGSPWAENV